MQTRILQALQQTLEGQTAESILRRCVHCGFCNATCPTYQLLGDENEGPRGRIYLIKQLMEGQLEADASCGQQTLRHLDHCLLCRSCETTCPSGVEYSKLLDIGRHLAEQQVGRPWQKRLVRQQLRHYLPRSGLFSLGFKLGKAARPVLPERLAQKLDAAKARPAGNWPAPRHKRRMLVLQGCVQPALAPDINAATARVLDRLGISLVTAPEAGCCGAVTQHLGAPETAQQSMRRNIDAWWPYLEDGVEAIISTASGCGATLKEYPYHLRDDPAYVDKAARVSALCHDIAEVISSLDYRPLAPATPPPPLAWHPPCSLQHGQKIRGVVETILTDCGFTLVPVADEHLCCGSAGTYSLLQPELAGQLRTQKLTNLNRHQPGMIVTANIGCQTHLQEGTSLPVMHWIQLLDNASKAV